MTSADIQQAILETLELDDDLDYQQVAASVVQAPFRVRQELRTLAHHRCVYGMQLPGADITYRISARGLQVAKANRDRVPV